MSDKIKPSEVSEVLLKALQGVNAEEKFDEVGTVTIFPVLGGISGSTNTI